MAGENRDQETNAWFGERLYDHVAQHHRIEEVLYRVRTGLQDLIIFRSHRFGRVLALDGVIQVTEGDEFVYHEMLSHTPILAHAAMGGTARRVLIVGGGDGGALRRVLMHRSVERATLVEIDRGVVDLCTRYMPTIADGAFDDARTDLVIADGARFVAETDQRFEVIIIDSTDPIGPGAVLFTQSFYADCRRCLAPGGILVTQSGVPFLQPDEVTHSFQRLGAVFPDVAFYGAAVPTYFGGLMTLGWASDEPDARRLTADALRSHFDAAGIATEYYTPEVHAAAFCLPAFVQRLMCPSGAFAPRPPNWGA